jgi:F-type H+-transporting ATPase subunit b
VHARMHRKKLLVGFVIALAAMVGFSTAAYAGGGESDTGPSDEVIEVKTVNPETGQEQVVLVDKAALEDQGGEVAVCVVEAVADDTDPAACQEAPNPILPAVNELIWGSLAFLILFVVMWKLAYPPIKKAMNDRSERIRTDLDEAERAKLEAQQTRQAYEAKLVEAKTEANGIIEEARKSADQLKTDLEKRAQADIAEMRQRAQADVEAAKHQAIADLHAEVASIAVGAAEVVVRKSLDPATQSQLVEDYINEIAHS